MTPFKCGGLLLSLPGASTPLHQGVSHTPEVVGALSTWPSLTPALLLTRVLASLLVALSIWFSLTRASIISHLLLLAHGKLPSLIHMVTSFSVHMVNFEPQEESCCLSCSSLPRLSRRLSWSTKSPVPVKLPKLIAHHDRGCLALCKL